MLIPLPVYLGTTFSFSFIQHIFIKNLFSASHWGCSDENGGWSPHYYRTCRIMGRWMWNMIYVLTWSGSPKASLWRKGYTSWNLMSEKRQPGEGMEGAFQAEEAACGRVLRPGKHCTFSTLDVWWGTYLPTYLPFSFDTLRKSAPFPEALQYRGDARSGRSEPLFRLPVAKIRLICCPRMEDISDIKLIRTDTTLDLSQKAEKRWPHYWMPPARGASVRRLGHSVGRHGNGHTNDGRN